MILLCLNIQLRIFLPNKKKGEIFLYYISLDRIQFKYNIGYLQQYEEAILNYDQAILLDQNCAIAYNNKGNSLISFYNYYILHSLQNYQAAIICYDKAIQLDPNYTDAYNNKGTYQQLCKSFPYQKINLLFKINSLQKYDEAIQFYDQAIQLDPDFAYVYKNKGIKLSQYRICFTQEQYYDIYIENLKQNKKAIECYRLAVIKGYQPKQELLKIIKELNKI